MNKPDLRGKLPESWACNDCGINTAPEFKNREQMEQAFALDWNNQGVVQTYNEFTEIYIVKEPVWEAAGLESMAGCLCIGCLERRIGRTLTANSFVRDDPLNHPMLPGTERLLERRKE